MRFSIEWSAPRHYCRPLQRRSTSGLIKAGQKATSQGGEQKKKPEAGQRETERKTEPRKNPGDRGRTSKKNQKKNQKKTEEEKQGKQGNNIEKCRNTKTNNTQRAGEKKGSIHIDKDCPCHCFIPTKTKRQNNNRYPQ